MSPNWLGSDGGEWNIRKNASEEWEGWMVRGGQVEEGAWAVKWGEDEEVLGYNSEVLGSNQKYLEILRSTWKCLDSRQSSEEKMKKYLGTTRKYMEVLGSIWTV